MKRAAQLIGAGLLLALLLVGCGKKESDQAEGFGTPSAPGGGGKFSENPALNSSQGTGTTSPFSSVTEGGRGGQ